ncbi:MAG TPA: hypothetical protein VGD30_05470 [Telluria sp.]
MSSSRRPGASEDSILASLERGSSGARTHRSWQLIGASAAGVLTLMIAWLAYGNATSVRALPPSAVRQVTAPPSDNGMPIEPVPSISIRAPEAAAIVDERVVSEKPALVMLPREDDSRESRVPEVAAKASSRPALAKTAPQPKRPAAKPAPAASKQVAKSTKPAVKRELARAPAPKKSKRATPASSATAEIDSDVALISAIVAHSSRHAEERAQQECQGKQCPPKSSTRP